MLVSADPILKTFKLDLKNLPTQFQNFNLAAVVWPSIGQQGRRQWSHKRLVIGFPLLVWKGRKRIDRWSNIKSESSKRFFCEKKTKNFPIRHFYLIGNQKEFSRGVIFNGLMFGKSKLFSSTGTDNSTPSPVSYNFIYSEVFDSLLI